MVDVLKRSINIDISTINFLTVEKIKEYKANKLLADYLQDIKVDDLKSNNPITNMNLFREYIKQYLHNNPNIHSKGFTFLVRELQPTENGLPLEIYVFVNDVRWVNYETVQADLFDHFFAILTYFDLKVFQNFAT